MKGIFRKVFMLLAMSIVLFVSSFSVHAENNPTKDWPTSANLPVGIFRGQKPADFLTKRYPTEVKISAKSSNPKVASVDAGSYYDSYESNYYAYCCVQPKKVGKTTITINVTVDGKTYTKKCQVSCYKYENPIKSLKINGKEYASQLNKKETKMSMKGVISIKLKSGYTLKSIKTLSSTFKQSIIIKNNTKLPDKTDEIILQIYNKKMKKHTILDIYLPYNQNNSNKYRIVATHKGIYYDSSF